MGWKDVKLLFEKRNRLFLILLVWLVTGIAFLQFLPLIGIIIFLPSIVFLLYLYLYSMVIKNDIRDVKLWKIGIYFFLSLPLLAILIIFLVFLFLFSIISYFFFTSWFILYGVYVVSNNLDLRMYKLKHGQTLRTIEFVGGFLLSFILLGSFLTGSFIFAIYFETSIFLNLIYFIVGFLILIFTIISIGYLFKKTFNAWLGLFYVLVVCYTFFLTFKVFIGLTGSGGSSSSLVAQISLFILDILIIFYSVSTILSSQAEILTEKLKYFNVDTVFIWLLFSKTSYEFAANFPYTILLGLPIPGIDSIVAVGSDLNLWKNLVILGFFMLLLVMIGVYEIRGYRKKVKQFKLDIQTKVQEITMLDPSLLRFSKVKRISTIKPEELEKFAETISIKDFKKEVTDKEKYLNDLRNKFRKYNS